MAPIPPSPARVVRAGLRRARRTSRRLRPPVPPAAIGLALVPAKVMRFAGEQWVRGRRIPVYPDAPAAPVRPAVLAQVAMDEAILAVMKSPSRYPSSADAREVAEELRVSWELHEASGWTDDPLSYHRPQAALSDPVISIKRWRGLDYEHLSWESTYVPWPGEPGGDRWLAQERNRTAHAYVVRHADPERPWVVCLHGLATGTPAADFMAFRVAHLHHELGLNVALPVMPLHGPRSTGRFGALSFLTYDLLGPVHGLTQALADTRGLLGWIRAQGGSQIGVHGISLGGKLAGLLALHEPELATVIAGIPLVDIPGLFGSHSPRTQRIRALRSELLGEAALQVHSVVSPLAAPPVVPRERLALYAGLGDRMTTPKQAHRLWTHWRRPEVLWFPGNHVAFMWSREVRRFVEGVLSDAGFAADQPEEDDAARAARVASLFERRNDRAASTSMPFVR